MAWCVSRCGNRLIFDCVKVYPFCFYGQVTYLIIFIVQQVFTFIFLQVYINLFIYLLFVYLLDLGDHLHPPVWRLVSVSQSISPQPLAPSLYDWKEKREHV